MQLSAVERMNVFNDGSLCVFETPGLTSPEFVHQACIVGLFAMCCQDHALPKQVVPRSVL